MKAQTTIALPVWAIKGIEARLVPLARICAQLAPIHALWNSKRGARRFPSRNCFSPRDLKRCLAHIAILRVIDDGRDFEYRLAGDAFMSAFGENIQGKLMSELAHTPTAEYQYISRDMSIRPTVASGVPHVIEYHISLPGNSITRRQVLHLPLGEDGKAVDHILTVSEWTIPLARS